jgi:hypothetical protein
MIMYFEASAPRTVVPAVRVGWNCTDAGIDERLAEQEVVSLHSRSAVAVAAFAALRELGALEAVTRFRDPLC